MKSENKQNFTASQIQVADLMREPRFDAIRNYTFEKADGDGELYSVWRQNTDKHLGRLAQVISHGKNFEQQMWDVQRDIALSTLDGESIGPFSRYFYHASVDGKPIEGRPGNDVTSADLPEGDYDVIATNNRIVALSRSEEDPLSFLEGSLEYAADRRRKGGSRFEGPENYATALKHFTDKTREIPLEGLDGMERAHKLVTNAVGNFLRVSERDEPNVVELMNVLVSVRNLPNGLVEKRFSAGILRHVLEGIDDFGDNGANIILGAMAKLDLGDCPEAAAMTADLVLRKGMQMHRSGDMLTALRAVSRLPKSVNSEHAVTTLFDVRNALEVASDIPSMVQMNKMLLTIVTEVTDNPNDTKRAKSTAEFIARRASEILMTETRARNLSAAQLERLKNQVDAIIENAKKI